MGPNFGLEDPRAEIVRKFRWIFILSGISASDLPQAGVYSLPPRKAARPSISFRTQEYQHLIESFVIPMKPEWQTTKLSLFDIKRCENPNRPNPTLEWILSSYPGGNIGTGLYNPAAGTWRPYADAYVKRDCSLYLLDGCGFPIERWIFENAYPEAIDFGDLEMELSDVVQIDLTLRYDRAYQLGVS